MHLTTFNQRTKKKEVQNGGESGRLMADQQKGPLLTAKPLSILIEKLTPSSHILLWGLIRANLVKKEEKKVSFVHNLK